MKPLLPPGRTALYLSTTLLIFFANTRADARLKPRLSYGQQHDRISGREDCPAIPKLGNLKAFEIVAESKKPTQVDRPNVRSFQVNTHHTYIDRNDRSISTGEHPERFIQIKTLDGIVDFTNNPIAINSEAVKENGEISETKLNSTTQELEANSGLGFSTQVIVGGKTQPFQNFPSNWFPPYVVQQDTPASADLGWGAIAISENHSTENLGFFVGTRYAHLEGQVGSFSSMKFPVVKSNAGPQAQAHTTINTYRASYGQFYSNVQAIPSFRYQGYESVYSDLTGNALTTELESIYLSSHGSPYALADRSGWTNAVMKERSLPLEQTTASKLKNGHKYLHYFEVKSWDTLHDDGVNGLGNFQARNTCAPVEGMLSSALTNNPGLGFEDIAELVNQQLANQVIRSSATGEIIDNFGRSCRVKSVEVPTLPIKRKLELCFSPKDSSEVEAILANDVKMASLGAEVAIELTMKRDVPNGVTPPTNTDERNWLLYPRLGTLRFLIQAAYQDTNGNISYTPSAGSFRILTYRVKLESSARDWANTSFNSYWNYEMEQNMLTSLANLYLTQNSVDQQKKRILEHVLEVIHFERPQVEDFPTVKEQLRKYFGKYRAHQFKIVSAWSDPKKCNVSETVAFDFFTLNPVDLREQAGREPGLYTPGQLCEVRGAEIAFSGQGIQGEPDRIPVLVAESSPVSGGESKIIGVYKLHQLNPQQLRKYYIKTCQQLINGRAPNHKIRLTVSSIKNQDYATLPGLLKKGLIRENVTDYNSIDSIAITLSVTQDERERTALARSKLTPVKSRQGQGKPAKQPELEIDIRRAPRYIGTMTLQATNDGIIKNNRKRCRRYSVRSIFHKLFKNSGYWGKHQTKLPGNAVLITSQASGESRKVLGAYKFVPTKVSNTENLLRDTIDLDQNLELCSSSLKKVDFHLSLVNLTNSLEEEIRNLPGTQVLQQTRKGNQIASFQNPFQDSSSLQQGPHQSLISRLPTVEFPQEEWTTPTKVEVNTSFPAFRYHGKLTGTVQTNATVLPNGRVCRHVTIDPAIYGSSFPFKFESNGFEASNPISLVVVTAKWINSDAKLEQRLVGGFTPVRPLTLVAKPGSDRAKANLSQSIRFCSDVKTKVFLTAKAYTSVDGTSYLDMIQKLTNHFIQSQSSPNKVAPVHNEPPFSVLNIGRSDSVAEFDKYEEIITMMPATPGQALSPMVATFEMNNTAKVGNVSIEDGIQVALSELPGNEFEQLPNLSFAQSIQIEAIAKTLVAPELESDVTSTETFAIGLFAGTDQSRLIRVIPMEERSRSTEKSGDRLITYQLLPTMTSTYASLGTPETRVLARVIRVKRSELDSIQELDGPIAIGANDPTRVNLNFKTTDNRGRELPKSEIVVTQRLRMGSPKPFPNPISAGSQRLKLKIPVISESVSRVDGFTSPYTATVKLNASANEAKLSFQMFGINKKNIGEITFQTTNGENLLNGHFTAVQEAGSELPKTPGTYVLVLKDGRDALKNVIPNSGANVLNIKDPGPFRPSSFKLVIQN